MGPEVKQDARPNQRTGMRPFACQEQRMLRALHFGWPMRRSHRRHELHWLACRQPRWRLCMDGRVHLRRSAAIQRRGGHGA
jgi:hypothetical protein